MRFAALVFVVALGATGCHSSETCRLRQENERLSRENAELRNETARLIKENQSLAAMSADDDDDDEDITEGMEIISPEELAKMPLMKPDFSEHSSKRQARDLMDPFPQTPSPNYERALQQAQDMYVHGYYKKAIEAASTARDFKPSKAFRIIGASACFLKDERTARRAYQAIDKTGQQFLKYVCSRNDIEL